MGKGQASTFQCSQALATALTLATTLSLATACHDEQPSPAAAAISGRLVVHQDATRPIPNPPHAVAVYRQFPPQQWWPSLAFTDVFPAQPDPVGTYEIDFEIPYVPSGQYFIGAYQWDEDGVSNPERQGALGGLCAALRGENKVTIGTDDLDNIVIHLWGNKGRLDPCFAEEAAMAGDAGAGDAGAMESPVDAADPYQGFDEPCVVDPSPSAAPFTSPTCEPNTPYCVPWPLTATEGRCTGTGCFANPERCPAGWFCLDPAGFGVEGFDDVGGVCGSSEWLGV